MNNKSVEQETSQTIEIINQYLVFLVAALGSDFPKFLNLLREIVQMLDLTAPGTLAAQQKIDNLFEWGLQSPAKKIFREILNRVNKQTDKPTARGEQQEDDAASYVIGANVLLSPPIDSGMNAEHPDPPPNDTPRFLNAGFCAHDQPCPLDQPLCLEDGPFVLDVNIGQFWGPGSPGEPLDELLALFWQSEDVLELEVAVRARTVVVEPPQLNLSLPRWGDSSHAKFSLQFKSNRPGARHRLDVDLFYAGHLLQSRRVEVEVVRKRGEQPSTDLPPQYAWQTFNRAVRLTPEYLAQIKAHPRRMTITSQFEHGRLELCFYDRSHAGLWKLQANLTESSLKSHLKRMRTALKAASDSYKDRVGGDLEQLRLNLWQMADAGFKFYMAALKDLYEPDLEAQDLSDLQLEPGQVIQIAPLSEHAGVPWEMLYERPIEPFNAKNPERVQLCPAYADHFLKDCPNQDNPRIVCPSGFWGYRYILEQLPCRQEHGQTSPQPDLPLSIRNQIPLNLSTLLYAFKNRDAHFSRLQELSAQERVRVSTIQTVDELERALSDVAGVPDILYFYTHGGFEQNEPGLLFGDSKTPERLTSQHLAIWKQADMSLRHSLVVLNACETAAYQPEMVDSLLRWFILRGAAGIIGTQITIPTPLADQFIIRFFRYFLSNLTLGQALNSARLEMLFNRSEGEGEPQPDPRGLAYSLFATADVRLGQPVGI